MQCQGVTKNGSQCTRKTSTAYCWQHYKQKVISEEKSYDYSNKHIIDGKEYYLKYAPCCDEFNDLYDAEGNYICSPTGGISGYGNGRCPQNIQNFFHPKK